MQWARSTFLQHWSLFFALPIHISWVLMFCFIQIHEFLEQRNLKFKIKLLTWSAWKFICEVVTNWRNHLEGRCVTLLQLWELQRKFLHYFLYPNQLKCVISVHHMCSGGFRMFERQGRKTLKGHHMYAAGHQHAQSCNISYSCRILYTSWHAGRLEL